MLDAQYTDLIARGQFVRLPEWPGYAVSADGRVWSCRKNLGGGRYKFTDEWKPLKGCPSGPHGHLVVNLHRGGKQSTKHVHRLVIETFVGPCPPHMECCHWDDDPSNNTLPNLRWDTRVKNKADSIRNGGHVPPPHVRGSRQGSAKLRECDIPVIRKLSGEGLGPKPIADRFGVSASTIDKILRGQSWKHV